MSATLFRSSARTALRLGASATPKGLSGMTFARGKATLPDLSCKLHVSLASNALFAAFLELVHLN